MHTDVIIAGAGPAGLMLATELCLAGVRPIVLERRPAIREYPRAGAFAGRIVDVLRYRGLVDRIEAAGGAVRRAPVVPFGNLYLDFARLGESPIWGVRLPQSQLERVLEERARELGADIRRGHEVGGVAQDATTVTVDVRGSAGDDRLDARFLVGCDGAHSRIRDLAGIAFPGTTYPEVNRLGRSTIHESVTRLENGDIIVPGHGLIRAGFTRTKNGVLALGALDPAVLGIQTTEDDRIDVDDDAPLSVEEFQASIRRVLGAEIPLGTVTRLSRYGFQARQAEHYRAGRVLLAGDAAHQFPATGIGINAGMLDAVNLGWKLAAHIQGRASAGVLDTYHDERHFAGARSMMQTQVQALLRRDKDPEIQALRKFFHEVTAYEEPLRHVGELIAGIDIRYRFAVSDGHALTGTFIPDLPIEMRNARPVFLDLAGRADLRAAARDWQRGVDIQTAPVDDRTADALLIRPDGHVAWAAAIDEPSDVAASTLRAALLFWFGSPDLQDCAGAS